MSATDKTPDKNGNSDSSTLDLNENEQRQIEKRRPPNANIVHEIIRMEGEDNLRRPIPALACSALAAGLAMGFSLVAQGLLRAALPDASWRPLLVNAGYSVGFLIVVLGRQQLFTENTLTPILPLLNRPDGRTLRKVLRLWAVVLLMNLVGALIFAWVVGHSDIFKSNIKSNFNDLGRETLAGGFDAHFLRAIFAGWLIALMIWLLPGAEQARVAVIFILTYLVGLGGLSHSIAGSVEGLYVVTTGGATWSAFLGTFLLPTVLGNILGGVALVAALNYGQVAPPHE